MFSKIFPFVSKKEFYYLLWATALLSSILIGYKLYQHLVFYTTAYDLSIFDYAMYNTLHGQFMQVPFHYNSLWKDNLYVFLLFLLPFYSLCQGPETLLIFQALAVSFSIIPLYLFARKHFDVQLSIAIVLVYLLNRIVILGYFFDFHVEMFEPLLMFSAFLCLEYKRFWGYLIAVVLCMTIKTDVVFYIIPFGIYLFLTKKDKRAGLATIGLAVIWFLFCFGYLMPETVPRGESNFIRFYQAYGKTIPEITMHLLTHPMVILQSLLTQPVFLFYASVLFLPWLDFRSILLSIIPLLPPLLIHDNIHNQFVVYVAIPAVPYLFYGSLSSLKTLQDRWSRKYPRLLPVLLISMILINLPNLWKYKLPLYNHHIRLVYRFLKQIPNDVSVSLQNCYLPHVTRRQVIYRLPENEHAMYVLIDNKAEYSHHFQLKDIRQFDNSEYELIQQEDDIYLYKRK